MNNAQTGKMDLVSRANALTLSVRSGGYLTLLQEQDSLGNNFIFAMTLHSIFFLFFGCSTCAPDNVMLVY